jgi:hypothetical protein
MSQSKTAQTPILFGGVAKDEHSLGSVLLALVRTLGREDLDEAVVVLDLRGRE